MITPLVATDVQRMTAGSASRTCAASSRPAVTHYCCAPPASSTTPYPYPYPYRLAAMTRSQRTTLSTSIRYRCRVVVEVDEATGAVLQGDVSSNAYRVVFRSYRFVEA